jgi:cytochrome c oxidase subunit 3
LIAAALSFLASRALRNGNKDLNRIFVGNLSVLALDFWLPSGRCLECFIPYGATLVNNNAAISLIYIVSGFHLLHIFGGLCFILNCLFGSYGKIPTAKAKYRMEIASIFWHFIDILWIYLYVFLLLNS